MKKLISSVLSAIIVMTLAVPAIAGETDRFGAYDRVVIIGIDGGGAFIKDATTPNIDRIFASGAVSSTAKAEFPTISAQNWGGMLLGVSAKRHGLTNDIVGKTERDSTEKYPSIFRLAREKYPTAILASFCNWNPINFGIIEKDIGVYKDTADDAELTARMETYLDANDPKLMFVQFDGVDGAGHDSGYGKSEHMAQITTVDGYVGRIYDKLGALGRLDGALFMVVTDHGGFGTGHGGLTKTETTVFLGVAGEGVVKSSMGSDARNRDVAAIALYALGINKPSHMTSNVPDEVFEGYTYTERPDGDEIGKVILSNIKDFFCSLFHFLVQRLHILIIII